MNKKQKLIYLTDDAIKKLELLKKINGFDNSKVIEILLKKKIKFDIRRLEHDYIQRSK